ncbi:syndecan [Trichogramma pretiosum]|uniref:syndecan n=1 Tax=Trichogramma pretiosum TaxID=7493 RepID=UPI000C71BAB0|nr:syndecan [Trichogramma pretiosum]
MMKMEMKETKKPDLIDGPKNNIETSRQPNNLKESEMESSNTSDVTINLQHKGRTSSFFAQPGVLAAIVGGAVVGLLCAILVVMFIVYRMRKKDEGSYALEEPRRSPATNSYPKVGVHANNREFYA